MEMKNMSMKKSEGYLENITIGNLETIQDDESVSPLLRDAIKQIIKAVGDKNWQFAYELSTVRSLIAIEGEDDESNPNRQFSHNVATCESDIDAYNEIDELHEIVADRLTKVPHVQHTYLLAKALCREQADVTTYNYCNPVIDRMDFEFQQMETSDPSFFKECIEVLRHELLRFKVKIT